MELFKVNKSHHAEIISNTLKTLFSEDESFELLEGLNYELEDGGYLYSIGLKNEPIGFLIATPLSDDMEISKKIDLISIEDIFINSGMKGKEIADSLTMEIKQLGKSLKVSQIEIIVSQSLSWLNPSLQNNGFIPSEVKLEKLLPRTNNLEDVLELIQDCTPNDRIVQVLMEKDTEFLTEFVEASDELTDLVTDGWIPVMVVVTYEPEGVDLQSTIDESNQILNWNDYSIVYNA